MMAMASAAVAERFCRKVRTGRGIDICLKEEALIDPTPFYLFLCRHRGLERPTRFNFTLNSSVHNSRLGTDNSNMAVLCPICAFPLIRPYGRAAVERCATVRDLKSKTRRRHAEYTTLLCRSNLMLKKIHNRAENSAAYQV